MRFWKAGGRLAATALFAIALASCDHVETPMEVGGQEQFAGEPQQLLDGLLGGLTGTSITVRAVDQYGVIRNYTLVREGLLTNLTGTLVQTVDGVLALVTQLVGVDGGTLTNLGHRLVVPSRAVDGPTTFGLGVLINGTTTVDLSAYAPGNSGQVNVGEEGFDRPVRLDMTYSRGSNIRDERKVVILRLNPAGLTALHEALPTTVDTRNNRGTVWLEHFSKYCMAM